MIELEHQINKKTKELWDCIDDAVEKTCSPAECRAARNFLGIYFDRLSPSQQLLAVEFLMALDKMNEVINLGQIDEEKEAVFYEIIGVNRSKGYNTLCLAYYPEKSLRSQAKWLNDQDVISVLTIPKGHQF